MLRRPAITVIGILVAGWVVNAAPAVADDGDAGTGSGGFWGSATDDGDDSGTDDGGTDDSSYDGTDSSSTGGGGGTDICDDESLTVQLGVAGGGCGAVGALDTGDPGYVPVVVDAREQAETAFERLSLATANVKIAPSPPLPTYPNLETWIWVPPSQWETLTMSVTAGATTVHVEARPVRIEIDAGERDQMKYSATTIDSAFYCSGPGRVWRESLGDDAQTPCGYTYQTTSKGNPAGGDHYDLTASIVYEGSWTCVGECTEPGGSLGQVNGPTGTQPVIVQERQSVVVD
jgi:hypothetical protein